MDTHRTRKRRHTQCCHLLLSVAKTCCWTWAPHFAVREGPLSPDSLGHGPAGQPCPSESQGPGDREAPNPPPSSPAVQMGEIRRQRQTSTVVSPPSFFLLKDMCPEEEVEWVPLSGGPREWLGGHPFSKELGDVV